jgi:hypothetical protein
LGRLYVSAESGIIAIFDERGRKLEKIGEEFFVPNAHSVAVDSKTDRVYFPLQNVGGDPPNDSPYSRDFNDPSWRALQQRAQALCARHKVFVYGLGLGQQTDIAVLRKVFPAQNVEVIVGAAAYVAYALGQVREHLSRTQLRQAIEQELSEGRVEARLNKSSVSDDVTAFDVPLTIRSTYRHLPIVVDQIKVLHSASSSPEISCDVGNAFTNFSLAPGREWRGMVAGRLKANRSQWRLGRAQENMRRTLNSFRYSASRMRGDWLTWDFSKLLRHDPARRL